jgi:hypothetical protein
MKDAKALRLDHLKDRPLVDRAVYFYALDQIDELKATVARLDRALDRMTARYIDAINRVPEPILPDCPMSDQARKIIDALK